MCLSFLHQTNPNNTLARESDDKPLYLGVPYFKQIQMSQDPARVVDIHHLQMMFTPSGTIGGVRKMGDPQNHRFQY